MKYITPQTDAGNSITDLLNVASLVNWNKAWRPVLGYEDDILCLENHTGEDYTITNASKWLKYWNIKIASKVVENNA
jgi:hypothetical protein